MHPASTCMLKERLCRQLDGRHPRHAVLVVRVRHREVWGDSSCEPDSPMRTSASQDGSLPATYSATGTPVQTAAACSAPPSAADSGSAGKRSGSCASQVRRCQDRPLAALWPGKKEAQQQLRRPSRVCTCPLLLILHCPNSHTHRTKVSDLPASNLHVHLMAATCLPCPRENSLCLPNYRHAQCTAACRGAPHLEGVRNYAPPEHVLGAAAHDSQLLRPHAVLLQHAHACTRAATCAHAAVHRMRDSHPAPGSASGCGSFLAHAAHCSAWNCLKDTSLLSLHAALQAR